MNNGIREFKKWLGNNEERFGDYSLDEIVNLAIACGFDRQMIAQWATSQRFKKAV